ncbi:MAG: hypothetical protein JSW71_13305 [Gemmatimonadota bacterium]|nr:MAG: hypothetical protein JSW71_13305 [Gemmatimonadota bacterium]
MSRGRYRLKLDKAGNWYIDVPVDSSATSVRVSFARDYFDPRVGDDGKVQIQLLAKQLEQEITGGTLRIENLFEHEGMRFPVEIDLGSRDDLEILIRVIRKVFKEGVKRSNQAREDGLERCRSRLAQGGALQEGGSEDHGIEIDRRVNGERRSTERRRWYSPPTKDRRNGERRSGTERRGMCEGRVA